MRMRARDAHEVGGVEGLHARPVAWWDGSSCAHTWTCLIVSGACGRLPTCARMHTRTRAAAVAAVANCRSAAPHACRAEPSICGPSGSQWVSAEARGGPPSTPLLGSGLRCLAAAASRAHPQFKFRIAPDFSCREMGLLHRHSQ